MTSLSWHWWAATASAVSVTIGRWLMTQLTNGQHAYVLVFMPMVDILNIPCDCHFVYSVLDELYVSHDAWRSGNILRVHYKSMKCNVSFWQGSVSSTLLHFARVVDDAKCIVVTSVCVSVCVSVRGRMPTLLHGPGCNLEEWYGIIVVHYWADLQSVHGLRCYGNITRTLLTSVRPSRDMTT